MVSLHVQFFDDFCFQPSNDYSGFRGSPKHGTPGVRYCSEEDRLPQQFLATLRVQGACSLLLLRAEEAAEEEAKDCFLIFTMP